jgi:hypothetical protein
VGGSECDGWLGVGGRAFGREGIVIAENLYAVGEPVIVGVGVVGISA